MGCDIHFHVDKLRDGVWTSADEWENEDEWPGVVNPYYDGRCYPLFSVLADVRNGYGFAGVDTGDRLPVIAEPRGLPESVTSNVRKSLDLWGFDGHSHSWLTLQEILAFDWTQTRESRGLVSLNHWAWAKLWNKRVPERWSGDVSGAGIVKVRDCAKDMGPYDREDLVFWSKGGDFGDHKNDRVYVKHSWTTPISDLCRSFWWTTIPRLLKLSEGDHASVRCVFWFDN